MANEVYEVLTSVTSAAESVLNSGFVIALLGSMAGAFGGAVGAQRIVERRKRVEHVREEIRHTNAATTIAFSICNTGLSLKKQHVNPLHDKFQSDRAALEEFYRQRESGLIPKDRPFHYEADFRMFGCPAFPIDTMTNVAFGKITPGARILSLVAVLEQSTIELGEVIKKRDKLIDRFQRREIPENEAVYYYFGYTNPSGHTNREYPDIVNAIHRYTDDVVFFSHLLCKDLSSHGESIREQSPKWMSGLPKVRRVDFGPAEPDGLIPSESEYQDWINGFRTND